MPSSFINSPVGTIEITTNNQSQVTIEFPDNQHNEKHHNDHYQLISDIKAYFINPDHEFNFTLPEQGSLFQQKVWHALRDIPAGKTKTYGELAKELKTSARAVGQACRSNPCPVIVPCHRIVGAKTLGGYAGDSKGRLSKIKQWLLRHECKSRELRY